MAEKQGDDSVGPSVESEDQEERILARRLRIQKRLETQRRAQQGDDDENSRIVEQIQTVAQRQMEDSYVRLRKLHEDGFEVVTNIRVAGDSREVARRTEEEEARHRRKEKLEVEAKAGAERFEEITKKWESALQKEIPQELHEALTLQRTACDTMLDEKNKLITDFQAELKAKDDQYVKDLKKQGDDIDLLIERMENQVKELTKAYRFELEEIEKAFVRERSELLDQHGKKWDAMLNERRQKEIDYQDAREKRVEDYEQQLQQLRIQDAEEYNQVKIKLETDVQILQQQLQQMKATYQLNQEKLEYNFQVLRKRDEENTITKSQQKRKITRLNDVLTNLKRKLAKQEKAYRDDNQQLTADYKHQLDQFRDVQRKAKTFMASDAKKFSEIWRMNEEEAKKLAGRVLDADRVIHEQQLGLQWAPASNLDFMDNVGPIVTERDRTRNGASAKKLADQIINTATAGESGEQATTQQGGELDTTIQTDSLRNLLGQFSPELIKHILELLCDESGFLIESKLLTLLAPLHPCEQTLMKLDAIFNALGIKSEEDVKTLSQYFLKFRSSGDAEMADELQQADSLDDLASSSRDLLQHPSSPDRLDVLQSADRVTEQVTEQTQPAKSPSLKDGQTDAAGDTARDDEAAEPSYRSVERVSSRTSRHSPPGGESASVQSEISPEFDGQTAQTTMQAIDANDVLKALRAFVEENHKQRKVPSDRSDSQSVVIHLNERFFNTDQDVKKVTSSGRPVLDRLHSTKVEAENFQNLSTEPDHMSAMKAKPLTEMQEMLMEKSQMSNQFEIVNVNERDDSEDAAYWQQYHNVVTPDRDKVWDALLYSFEKYYEVLSTRSKLIEETDALRQQNGELRLLLQQYVNDKINQDLQVPPTSVYQFNKIM